MRILLAHAEVVHAKNILMLNLSTWAIYTCWNYLPEQYPHFKWSTRAIMNHHMLQLATRAISTFLSDLPEKYPHVEDIYLRNIHMLKLSARAISTCWSFFTRKGPTHNTHAAVVYVNRNFMVNLSPTVSTLAANHNENFLRLKFSISWCCKPAVTTGAKVVLVHMMKFSTSKSECYLPIIINSNKDMKVTSSKL
jgi:hypothetical protein